MKKVIISFLTLVTILPEQSCLSQNEKSMSMITREPAVAGRFYPASENELKRELSTFFEKADITAAADDVRAIVVPHAGYAYSGEVAAHGYSQVPKHKMFDNIFIIGSSHYTYFDGASIYDMGNYRTPLGEVKVNIDIVNNLINKYECFEHNPEAHQKEHSLEVQLPFIQHHFENVPTIIPIIIGTQRLPTIEEIATALKPYFQENNLFVISTDFSHYPPYQDALQADENTAVAIVKNSPKEFLHALKENQRQGFKNLQTSICGWTSVLTLLNITQNEENISYHKLMYKNSGDQPFGSKDRVVGYYTISVTRVKELSKIKKAFSLTVEDKRTLLEIARSTISSYTETAKIPEIRNTRLSDELKTATGAFVSLHKYEKLRGCIGKFQVSEPLYKLVQQMAVAAAFQDYRFPPVTPDEVPELIIEISVLTPMKQIHDVREIELGKHGVYMKKGPNTGTFLPQVAMETGWDLEHFLGHCARDKARIGWDGWKDAELYVYEAEIFNEELFLQ